MSMRNGKNATPAKRPTQTLNEGSDHASIQDGSSVRERQRPSPYLLLIYPILLALGSLFFYVSPLTRTHSFTGRVTEADPTHSPTESAEHIVQHLSYFARKTNIFNVYFVKLGWFWTLVAHAVLQAAVYNVRQQQKVSTTRLSLMDYQRASRSWVNGAARWLLVNVSYYIIVKSFFGPSLIERFFTLTGGHCEALTNDPIDPLGQTSSKLNQLAISMSERACKAAGGSWRGGHDISGHVFMLVLSSAFLLYELAYAENFFPPPLVSPTAAANISKSMTEEEKELLGSTWADAQASASTTNQPGAIARPIVYVVVALDLWMLLMTAVFFHTWLEKLSGLVLAGGSIWIAYFLGDFVPVWKKYVD